MNVTYDKNNKIKQKIMDKGFNQVFFKLIHNDVLFKVSFRIFDGIHVQDTRGQMKNKCSEEL